MEGLQEKLISEADSPNDSQLSVLVSKTVQTSISYARPFGDIFCVLLDASVFNPWSSLPMMTFVGPTGSAETSYPVTTLPETRHILGMETCLVDRTVIIGHFNYPPSGESLIKIDIYDIDGSFNATLVRVFSTETECSGSGLLGTFASPKLGEFVVLWGDLSNDTFFDTFKVTLKDKLEVKIDTTRTEVRTCQLRFGELDELSPGPAGSVYACKVYAVGGQHPDCLAVLMSQIKLSPDAQPKQVFHRVVRLPFALLHVPKTHFKNKALLYASIERTIHLSDGTARALLRVMVEERELYVTAKPKAAALPAGEGGEKVESAASQVGATDPAPGEEKPRTVRKITHRYTHLLLHLQRNCVLDMYTHEGGWGGACTIDPAGERIVRFVSVVVEEEQAPRLDR